MFIVLLLLQCNGVDDGARTHDHRNHNPGLYQLSYAHHYNTTFTLYPDDVGTPCRIRTRDLRLRRPLLYPTELRAHVTAVNNGRGREIRTPDILLPKQARYQTALYPVHRLLRRNPKSLDNTATSSLPTARKGRILLTRLGTVKQEMDVFLKLR